MHMKETGARLCALRLALGLTQEQVAAAIFTGRANYAKMESGDRDIKTEHCIALADFFGVSCDYLLRGTDTANLTLSSELGLTDAAIEHLKALAVSKDWHDHDKLLAVNMLLRGDMDNLLEAIYSYIHVDFSVGAMLKEKTSAPLTQHQVFNGIAFKSPEYSANPTGYFQFPIVNTFEDAFRDYVLRLLKMHRDRQQRSRTYAASPQKVLESALQHLPVPTKRRDEAVTSIIKEVIKNAVAPNADEEESSDIKE